MSVDMRIRTVDCLAFEGAKVGTGNVFCGRDVLFPDGAVPKMGDCDVTEVARVGTHDDVLKFTCGNRIAICTLGVMAGSIGYGGNEGSVGCSVCGRLSVGGCRG